jgi:hypothetical protein
MIFKLKDKKIGTLKGEIILWLTDPKTKKTQEISEDILEDIVTHGIAPMFNAKE